MDALREYYDTTEAKLEGWIESADDHMEKAASAIKGAISHIRTMLG